MQQSLVLTMIIAVTFVGNFDQVTTSTQILGQFILLYKRQTIDGLSAYFSTSVVPSDGSVILNIEAEVTTEPLGLVLQCKVF